MAKVDFNELEDRALALKKAGRFREAAAVYFSMADGDPSLDAGYLAMRIGECHEALGELHAAKYWFGRAVEENPDTPEYIAARQRLEDVDFDALPVCPRAVQNKRQDNTKTIDLNQIKVIMEKLLDAAIQQNGSALFELSDDLYWQIEFPKQFDMSSKPTIDEVGSLHDDWELTHQIEDDPAWMIVSAYTLTEVAPILAYIGNKVVRVG